MQVQAYLTFDGQCEEAINFYKKAVKAEVVHKHYFKEAPDQNMITPENAGKIMHAMLRVGENTFMLSDGQCSGKASFDGFNMNVMTETETEAEKIFSALSDGGQITMPMSPTFFAARFGMLKDRFGVSWMIMKPTPFEPKAH